MRVAMLAPISWRVPPRHYGPWERVVSLLTEGLVERGIDVTLFATGDSVTRARLAAVCPRPYSEDPNIDAKVWECLHISALFERAGEFDLIHNHFDFLPLSYAGLVRTPVITTIHGFSSERILAVFQKYNEQAYYVAISEADRHAGINYVATIHHGIALEEFTLRRQPGDYLLFFGRIHPDKGVVEAIDLARRCDRPLVIAGIIQDKSYFESRIEPQIDGDQIRYLGSIGPEERDRVLGGAYALIHLINFDEPFGLSMIEAMACGTPVIACRRGSAPEVILDRQTGFIVDGPDQAVEAVRRVIELDREGIRRYIENNFSRDRMVDDYLRVYNEVLLKRTKIAERSPLYDERPWGSFQVLDEASGYKVKRIEVLPGKRLSYQKHSRRSEHWMIVTGSARVTIDGGETIVEEGDVVDVPVGASHRIENPRDRKLVFIEIQRGDYLGEDDIVRIQDDFGRGPPFPEAEVART
jgi:glycosyltransferase involved in cell wall biosynthesis/mannose-6-phosphate isomerase-like protein (cupin superfamily)